MFTLLKNAYVFAPEDMGINDVLLCGNKIIQVESNIQFVHTRGITVDLEGKTLVPGFIDQHVHIIGGGGEMGFRSLIQPVTVTDCVLAGVTTVVGLLGTDDYIKNVKTLVAHTKTLNLGGITAYCLTGAYEYPPPTVTGSVKEDLLFIQEVIGTKLAMSDHRASYVTRDELLRLASQVRVAALTSGKVGVIHIHMGKEVSGMNMLMDIVSTTDFPIKHFKPTHVQKCLEHAKAFWKRGGWIDFTASSNPNSVAELILSLGTGSDTSRITLSSDANGSAPVWDEQNNLIGMGVGRLTSLYDVVRCMVVDFGVPLNKAICYITKNVANSLEIFPQKGTIAAGSDADLVILDNDYRINSVISGGQFLLDNNQILVKEFYRD